MKKSIFTKCLLIAIITLLTACEKKHFVDIQGLATYFDPIKNFSIKYPSNWKKKMTTGEKFIAFTSDESFKRFKGIDGEGESGAKIEIFTIKMSEGQTLDTLKDLINWEGISAPKDFKIDGVNGFVQSYQFERADGMFKGMQYGAMKDNNFATVIVIEAFGDLWEKYEPKFNEIIQSVKLAHLQEVKKDTVTQIVQAEPPSATLTNFSGEGFSIKIPNNFDAKQRKSGGALKSYFFDGERRGDSYIQIDIFDASKQNNAEKLAKDNKAKHGGGDPRQTSIGGEKAFVFDYSASAQVKARVYYVVKNNKLYRITMNWFVGEEQMFKPVFEKSIGTFSF